ncbi:hypothetical protein GGI07_001147 [Coemansia sp. Benny D115]|nr:hypothetical protein GGI07_001147 [Coemansia sp. Benny D115]
MQVLSKSSFAALAAISHVALGEDLLAAATTVTNIQSYEAAVKSMWVSVYYRVNQNLWDIGVNGDSKEYADAVKLYGTTQLPAAYPTNWAPGYVSRAQALQSQTAHPTATSSEKEEESSDSDSESDSESESSKHSSTTSGASSFGKPAGTAVGVVAAAAALAALF